MNKFYFASYGSRIPWCGDWFYKDLEKLSVYDWEKTTIRESRKLKNSHIVFWNYQAISRYRLLFLRALKRYKEKGNTIIGGVRGSRTLRKYGRLLNYFDMILVNPDIVDIGSYADLYKVHYAPDGIDPLSFFPKYKTKKELIITWIGRKKKFKNFDIIPKLGYKYKVPGKYVPNHLMYKFYNSGNVYVCCSDTEGFGRGIVESALCELAIVSSSVGVAPAIVDPDFIIKGNPQDKIQEYKEVLKLFEDPELRARVGRENRIKALEFDIKKIVPIWDQALGNLI